MSKRHYSQKHETVVQRRWCKKNMQRYKHICKGCSQEFSNWSNTRTFCSTECYRKNTLAEKSPHWVGEKTFDQQGYVWVSNGGYKRIKEHILIVQKALGRKLKKGEVVHHINGIKSDNRNHNLLVCTPSYHKWLHHKMSELYQKEHFGGV